MSIVTLPTLLRKLGLNRYFMLPDIDPAFMLRACGVDCKFSSKSFETAVFGASVDIISMVANISGITHIEVFNAAVYLGRIDVMEAFPEVHTMWYNWIHAVTCGNNRLDVLEWLYQRYGSTFPSSVYNTAGEYGFIDVLDWAKSRNLEIPHSSIHNACVYGQINSVKWFHSNGIPYSVEDSHQALLCGHIDLFKYIRDEGCPCDYNTINCAVASTRIDETSCLEILEYLHNGGCPLNASILESAIYARSIGKLDWALSKGILPYIDATRTAVVVGYMPVIEHIFDLGFPTNEFTATHANNIEVLRYVHQRGCMLHPECYTKYICNGNIEMLNYVYSNGVIPQHSLCAQAIRYNNLEILQWLMNRGYMQDNMCILAIKNNCMEILQWLHGSGYVDKNNLLEYACRVSTVAYNWLVSVDYTYVECKN